MPPVQIFSANGWILSVKTTRKLYCHYPGVDEEPPVIKGDVNGDGEVNIADVNVIITSILTGQLSLDVDVNRDGEVNIADVNAVIDIILG